MACAQLHELANKTLSLQRDKVFVCFFVCRCVSDYVVFRPRGARVLAHNEPLQRQGHRANWPNRGKICGKGPRTHGIFAHRFLCRILMGAILCKLLERYLYMHPGMQSLSSSSASDAPDTRLKLTLNNLQRERAHGERQRSTCFMVGWVMATLASKAKCIS